MSSTGPLQQIDSCPGGNCDPNDFDDSKCTDICKCCVGISDYGDHNKCTSACRKCRNFGTTWDPRRPMKPLPYTDMYNDFPGYSTTGEFIEGFSMPGQGMVKQFLLTLAVIFAGAKITKKKLSIQNMLIFAAVATIARTMINY